MGPKVIYKFNQKLGAPQELIVPDLTPLPNGTLLCLRLPAGELDYIMPDTLATASELVELDYDIRKWPKNISVIWTKHLAGVLYKRQQSMKKTTASSKALSHAKKLADIVANLNNLPVEVSYTHIKQLFNKQEVFWGELVNVKPKPKKIHSRRVKQSVAKKYKTKLVTMVARGAAIPALQIPSSSQASMVSIGLTQGRYLTPVWKNEIDFKSRQHEGTAKEDAIGWLAYGGARNKNFQDFGTWYESEGRFTSLSTRDQFKVWYGIKSGEFALRKISLSSHAMGYVFYHCRETDDKNSPKPPGWPLDYLGRFGVPEETRALSGKCNKMGDEFLYWFTRVQKLNYCKEDITHNSFRKSCKACCKVVYTQWNNEGVT